MHRLGPEVVGGPVFWPVDQAREVLHFYRDWVGDCSDELMTIVVQRKVPDLPVVLGISSARSSSRSLPATRAMWPKANASCNRSRTSVHRCSTSVFQSRAWRIQRMFDPSFRHGNWYYVRSCDVAALTDDVIDVMVQFDQQITSPVTSVALWQMGGAVAQVEESATAFHGRHAGFTFNINGNSESAHGFEDQRAWAGTGMRSPRTTRACTSTS